MKKYLCLILLCLFLPTVAMGQVENNLDGQMWQSMDSRQKSYYLKGLYDGVVRLTQAYKKPLMFQAIFGSTLNLEQLQTRLDSFYSDYDNQIIPASEALIVITAEALGKSRADTAGYVEQLRKKFR